MSMKQKDYGLNRLEDKYLDSLAMPEQVQDIYDIPMTRTLIIN